MSKSKIGKTYESEAELSFMKAIGGDSEETRAGDELGLSTYTTGTLAVQEGVTLGDHHVVTFFVNENSELAKNPDRAKMIDSILSKYGGNLKDTASAEYATGYAQTVGGGQKRMSLILPNRASVVAMEAIKKAYEAEKNGGQKVTEKLLAEKVEAAQVADKLQSGPSSVAAVAPSAADEVPPPSEEKLGEEIPALPKDLPSDIALSEGGLDEDEVPPPPPPDDEELGEAPALPESSPPGIEPSEDKLELGAATPSKPATSLSTTAPAQAKATAETSLKKTPAAPTSKPAAAPNSEPATAPQLQNKDAKNPENAQNAKTQPTEGRGPRPSPESNDSKKGFDIEAMLKQLFDLLFKALSLKTVGNLASDVLISPLATPVRWVGQGIKKLTGNTALLDLGNKMDNVAARVGGNPLRHAPTASPSPTPEQPDHQGPNHAEQDKHLHEADKKLGENKADASALKPGGMEFLPIKREVDADKNTVAAPESLADKQKAEAANALEVDKKNDVSSSPRPPKMQ